MNISYDVKLQIQNSSSNCVQTSTSQLISFFNKDILAEEIEKEIPIRYNQEGKPLGTLLPDIGQYLIKLGFKVKLDVFDAQIIDRSWENYSQEQILIELKKLQETGISTARTPYTEPLLDSDVDFLKLGGVIKVSYCTTNLLTSLLQKAPIMVALNYNYLYKYPRSRYDLETKHYVKDFADGKVIDHVVVVTGFINDKFLVNDPDDVNGGKKEIERDILIGAICTAQINSDNMVMSINI